MNRKKLVILVCTMLMITSLIFTHNEKVNASDEAEDWWDYEWSYCKRISFSVALHNNK